MSLALRARAAFAAGYGEFGTFPIPSGARAVCQAIEASPYSGPEVEHLIVEAGRAAGARAAREKSHTDLYDYHRQELGKLLFPVLGRIDRDRVAHELVTQATVQTQTGATPVTRRRVLVATALAAIRAEVHPEDKAALDSLNAASWAHATAYGQAEATATPKTGGTPSPAKVAALALAALTALGASGTTETATWTDAELETIAMGAAIAAGDGAATGDLARLVAAALYSTTRAQNVYVSQLHQALNQAFVARTTQLFPTAQYDWVINSGNPCSTCTELAAAGPYAADALPTTPPMHPNCFPAGTLVEAAGVQGSTQRWTDGELVEIRTASGNLLAGTPNHPILTPEGWVALGRLVVGGNVVSRSGSERVGTSCPHDYDGPARIEDVAEAFGRARSVFARSVPVATEDFHGDGITSEVCVVRTDGELRGHRHTTVGEPHSEHHFLRGNVEVAPLSGQRGSALLLERLHTTSNRIMGSNGVGSALLRAETTYAPIAESLMDGWATDSVLKRKLEDALSTQVTADKVVSVRRFPFAGHVYNLQTKSHAFIAGGIVVHNCQCNLEVASTQAALV